MAQVDLIEDALIQGQGRAPAAGLKRSPVVLENGPRTVDNTHFFLISRVRVQENAILPQAAGRFDVRFPFLSPSANVLLVEKVPCGPLAGPLG